MGRVSTSWVVLLLGAGSVLGQNSFVNWETPHVTPLALTPDGSRLLAVNTPDNRLEVFDLTSGWPVPLISIPVGLDPVSVRARSDAEVWVVNHISDSISVVDLTLGSVVRTIRTLDEPCDVVFAGAPQRAFISCSQANQVMVLGLEVPSSPPVILPIVGEDPRAMAVSADGSEVYVAVFESGNATTILGGGSVIVPGFTPNVVGDPMGPYGGVNPPPNAGAAFDPPINPTLPPPPAVGLTVRKDAAGHWMDDNGGDWTDLVSGPLASHSGRLPGWDLLDHDVAIIHADTLAVSYADGLMNICMALAVNPATGEITVVGTDAINEVRFEPKVNGQFVRVHLGIVDPAATDAVSIVDLNDHLTYAVATIPQSERDKSLGDPRGVAWNAAGTRGYVTGMGSNNVIVIDASGQRVGAAPTIEVGEGPTGIVLAEADHRLYVLNKFESSISVVDVDTELEVGAVPFYDPSPPAIKIGRKQLYGTHETSGLGHLACASCHVDARMDRLAWDLGNPAGTMNPFDQNCGNGVDPNCQDWHPMKGPMTTQTLQDIIGKEPFHWRGDKDGLEEFNGAFVGLMGDDEQLTPQAMQEFEDFLATIFFPPNPFRTFTNGLPVDLPLPGHFTSGRFGPPGQPLPNGNAVVGLNRYRTGGLDGVECVSCHTLPTGMGSNFALQGTQFVPLPPGPEGGLHHATVSVDGSTNVTMKIPHLRNLYEKVGFDTTQLANVAGFGLLHDGSVDSIARFISEPLFSVVSDQDVANIVAFMLAFSGSDLPMGSPQTPLELPGPFSKDAHAAVGTQTTLVDLATADPQQLQLIDSIVALAESGAVGLVVKGNIGGFQRGGFYSGAGLFQTDQATSAVLLDGLLTLAEPGSELTFTVVPEGTQVRIGVDRDEDGFFDLDEILGCSDPADPSSMPPMCAACFPPSVAGEGGRYLAVTPVDEGQPLALRVEGDPGDAQTACVSLFVQADGSLGEAPVFQMPEAWATVHVHGLEIIPDASYQVQTVCGIGPGAPESPFVAAATWGWGDVSNDGIVNLADVQLVVFRFQGTGSATLEAADLDPCVPDGVANFADVSRDVQVFQGGDFSAMGCSVLCP